MMDLLKIEYLIRLRLTYQVIVCSKRQTLNENAIDLPCNDVDDVDRSLFMMPNVTSITWNWFQLAQQTRWDLNILLLFIYSFHRQWKSSKFLFVIFFCLLLHNSCVKSKIRKNCLTSRWAVEFAFSLSFFFFVDVGSMILSECSP